jgi:dihydropteroate synthase
MAFWQTSRRQIPLDRTLVMGILNVTPDSFSDGGAFVSVDAAIAQAEKMIDEGVDIIDIGGESTRPGSQRVSVDEEISRVITVVQAVAGRFDIPLSIDTTKASVAQAATEAGAEIINDISGLRFEPELAVIAAQETAGLVLMHSRGKFEALHSQPAVPDIFSEITSGLGAPIDTALAAGVGRSQIVLDIGLGFGKTFEQNLELIAKLDTIVGEFADYPILAGASRKSFIGKILNGVPADDRLGGSIAAAVVAVLRGARIVRVHDVKETVAAIRVAERLMPN